MKPRTSSETRRRSTHEISASYHTSTIGVRPVSFGLESRSVDMTGRVATASIETTARIRP